MAKFDVETLDDALYRIGNLEKRDLVLLVWTDIGQNKTPIVRPIRITVPDSIKQTNEIINAINGIVLILAIIDEHKNVYSITKSNDVANKASKEEKKVGKTKK